MRCNEHRAKFTERYDGQLSAASLQDLEAHCQSCAACETEWTNYLQAVVALKGVQIPSLADDYLDGILNATLGKQAAQLDPASLPGSGDTFQNARRRPLWSHLGAALAGAALMLLLVRLIPAEGLTQAQGGSLEERGNLVALLPLPLSSGPGGIEGNAPAGMLAQPVASEVSVSQAPTKEALQSREPRVKYLPRAVFLPVPLPVAAPAPVVRQLNTRALNNSIASASRSFLRLSRALEENAEQLLTASQERARSAALTEGQDTSGEKAFEPSLIASANPSRSVKRAPSTLAIQRRDERVSLSTHGTLEEVVPALIQRLDDEDPAIGELVQIRLQEIWSERMGTQFNESPMSREPQALDIQDIGWRKFVQRKAQVDDAPTITEQWTTWWSGEQVSLASAAF